MKHIAVLTAVLLLTASLTFAQSGSITVDNIDGLWTDAAGEVGPAGTDYLAPGAVTYNLRYTNNYGVNVLGMTNGFVVNGPASFIPATGEMLDFGGQTLADFYDLIASVSTISSDGAGDDQVTASFSVGMAGTGIPDGFDEVAIAIHSGCETEGETLCLDTMYYPPSGLWKWAGASQWSAAPDWGGPYCYDVVAIPNLRPEITNCPTSAYTGSHCDLVTYDFNAEDAEGDPFTFVKESGVGTIDASSGAWSYAPTLADVGASLSVVVHAEDAGGAGPACTYDLSFTNEGPAFTEGCGVTYFSGADMNTEVMVAAEDGDCDPVTITFLGVAPAPEGTVTGTNPVVFTPTINDTGTVFTFTFNASDGDVSKDVTCEAYVDVKGETNFEIVIEKDHGDDYYPYGVIQGQHTMVDVSLEAGSEIPAGFDLLIAYDASALSFQSAVPGSAFYEGGCGWEYFNYRFGADGNCGNACPSGVLRVVGIAETNNGPNHPSCLKPSLPATMFSLDFLVSNDRTYECMFVPIRFYWMDCGDNSLAFFPLTAPDSVVQGIENSVWNYYGGYEPNEYMEVTSPAVFPGYFGAPDECMNPVPDKPDPKRIIDFYNGGIDIICSDDIDARGDVNLNGESNEIADAVLFSNYFIQGLDVFKVNVDGQIAATDVNADGLTLSVADLVYLIRVIVGDAVPYAKLSTVSANYTVDAGVVSVDREMGGAFLTVAGNVTPTLLANDMELKYASDGDVTRILVSSMDGNTFAGDFLQVNGEILSIELASANGSVASLTQMPTSFELAQNYPNPFNPTTTIGFSMKNAGEYSLTIYNVTGQKVASFEGTADAGNHTIEWDASNEASGIYFYKFSTKNFTDTKKMVLLK